MRIVCIDIEGGHGGSSRSLFHVLKAYDRKDTDVSVICRKGGWIQEAYESRGFPFRVEPDMPRRTALRQFSRNLVSALRFRTSVWPRSAAFRRRLMADLDGADILHLNHISLTDLAVWVQKRRPDLTITMHIRTMPIVSSFAIRQTKTAAACCDAFVFITENERDHFESLLGAPAPGAVIYNPADSGEIPLRNTGPRPRTESPLIVACLSNYSYMRGLDRLIDIAAALPAEERHRIKFVVAGDMAFDKSDSNRLGSKAKGAKSLPEMVEKYGLSESFEFLGHVSDPEKVLAEADLAIKPTRENNPWGRDILEALSAGIPVVSVGTYDRFVESGVTGLLQSRFDAEDAARFLVSIADSPETLAAMGTAARDRLSDRCAPAAQAAKLKQFWQDAAAGTIQAPAPSERVGAVLPAYSSGGSERVLTHLVGSLPQPAFRTRLFVLSDDGTLAADLRTFGFVHNLSSGPVRRSLATLWSVLRGFHCDIVVSSQAHLNIALLFLGRLLPGVKVVVREANMPSQCLKNGHWPTWYRPLYGLALKGAAQILASSEFMAADIARELSVPKERIAVLYNPVDADALRATAMPLRRTPGAGRRFVAVGRLVPQKGFDRLISWFQDMDTDDRLEILGNGPAYDRLAAQIAALGLQDRVELLGFQANPAPFIGGADALLLPSRWEGMPNAALEALALGTPVIATAESGAISEVAELAAPNASESPVFVAESGDDFVTAMKRVTPTGTGYRRTLRTNLLPRCFEKNISASRFCEILRNLGRST